jgi:L-lactate permease
VVLVGALGFGTPVRVAAVVLVGVVYGALALALAPPDQR